MKIITLTLNPAFDMHCHIENFKPYHENLAKITDYDASGKGVNISRALNVGGTENLAFVVLGAENGDSFARGLAADKINFRSITLPGRIRENITVHTNGANETRISFSGFSADDSLADRVIAELSEVDSDTVVTFTGRATEGMSKEAQKHILREFAKRGAKIVIDSKSFDLADMIEMKPWLIKPNQEEISEYLCRRIESFEEVLEAANELYGKGIENVMISLGEKGALLVCADGAFVAEPPQIEALSTIGAGDSSIAGFLAAAKAGKNASESLRTAVSYGSAACMTEGTRPPEKNGITYMLERVQVKKI